MMKIAFNTFVRRQTFNSEFSHFEGSDEELLARIADGMPNAKQGYREGVLVVPLASPEGFFSSVVQLKEGDVLIGEFKARRKGETPRKSVRAVGQKMPAKGVEIILYSHDVLAEDGDAETEAEWEIISINANITEDEMPIPVGTLLANHFKADGGTATNLSDAELVAMLKKSFEFWSDKALCSPITDIDKEIIVSS